MALATPRSRTTESRWRAGILAGLVAGVGMGVVLHLGANMMPFIGALYGHESVLWGWLAHLLNSVVFAVVFVAVISIGLPETYKGTPGEFVMLGVGFGAALGVLGGGVFLPLWMGAVGASTLPTPIVPVGGMDEVAAGLFFGLAHLVYGTLLGGTYEVLYSAVPVSPGDEPEAAAEA